MTKISQLVDIGANLAANDEFIIRDLSEAGTPNKKVTASGFVDYIVAQGTGAGFTQIAAGVGPLARALASSSGATGTLTFSTASATTLIERARIDSSGRLLVGTSTANTSGAKLQTSDGLTFPATAVASADPNTLDDYEEGTWTPSIGGDATYTSRSGTYTKVGRKVSILGTFVVNTKGTGSATIVSGLPFAASALTPAYVGIFQNLAINVVFLLGTIPATTSRVDFTSLSSAGGTTPNETSVIGNSTRIDFAATYFV